MWVVIFYDEDGEVMEECAGVFYGHASADQYGAERRGDESFYGYRVLRIAEKE